MEQRRQIITRYIGLGIRSLNACRIAGISKSSYYYKAKAGPKGKRPSAYTFARERGKVSNQEVVEAIKGLIGEEFHDYGYKTVTMELRKKGFFINKKKVYRLMKTHKLLMPKVQGKPASKRNRVEWTSPEMVGPFSTVEVDLKYVYIQGLKRNALLISFICTFSRMIPVWTLELGIKAKDVVRLAQELVNHPAVKRNLRVVIRIRTDNGPQFIAKLLAEKLKELGLEHEFIKPATPEQNGHIESFHSKVKRAVTDKYEFETLEEAKGTFGRFYHAYNHTRSMEVLLYNSPSIFIELWEKGKIGVDKTKHKFYFRERPDYLQPLPSS